MSEPDAPRNFDVVVIGAGPAGLAAACRASAARASVCLVDDNPRPGGQIWRASLDRVSGPAVPWISTAARQGVRMIAGARVFAAPEPGRLALETAAGASLDLRYRSLVLATGARERFLPFPGWTLPNVMGAGGLQSLARSGLPVRGKKVVVAGSGPLLLAVARFLRHAGAGVRLIAEQAPLAALLRFASSLLRHPHKLADALIFRGSLAGVPYLASCWPVSAQGDGRLQSVTLSRGGRTFTEPCDYLACGFGLVPNTELAALLGCRMSASAPGEGVAVDEYQQTSVAGVYAAGEITGIGGLDVALVEGEIAGHAAAGQPERASRLFEARHRRRHFAQSLARSFALREELKHLAADDTFVCRCEDVPLGRIRASTGWREAKLQTRCGMGPCQSRVCGPPVEFLLGWKPDSVRPPLFPVTVNSLTQAGVRGIHKLQPPPFQ
ncbi:MAG: FAD-dependent oxidoreductase [Bryobacteraceae bacterium]|jgi:NADPH-dependent 2,4-dienoyl-CoA reductase/sulfur reductase-like enzyme